MVFAEVRPHLFASLTPRLVCGWVGESQRPLLTRHGRCTFDLARACSNRCRKPAVYLYYTLPPPLFQVRIIGVEVSPPDWFCQFTCVWRGHLVRSPAFALHREFLVSWSPRCRWFDLIFSTTLGNFDENLFHVIVRIFVWDGWLSQSNVQWPSSVPTLDDQFRLLVLPLCTVVGTAC